jgi:hypothetical protein
MSRAHAELSGIENHEDFRDQGFHRWLSSFAADEIGDFIASLAQNVPEPAKHTNALGHRRLLPANLRVFGAQDGVQYVFRCSALQLT